MKQPQAEPPRPPPSNPNNPNGTPFGRSQSTRVPSSSKKGFDPSSVGADEGQARSAYRSNYERPKASPMGEDIAEDVPFSEANRVRTPYFSSNSGERMSMFGEGVGRSASVRNSPTHRPPSSTDPGSFSDSGHRQRASYSGSPKDNPFPHMYVSSSDEEVEASVFSKGRKHRGPPPPKDSPQQRTSSSNIFGTPQQHAQQGNGTSPVPGKSKSEESINVKFSPAQWHGKFEGTEGYFAPTMSKSGTSKGRVSPSRGRSTQRPVAEKKAFTGQPQQPLPPVPSFPQFSQMPPPPPGPPPPMHPQTTFPSGDAPAPHAAKFTSDVWQETFKEPSWAYPTQTQTKETSPRRASVAPKRSVPARKGSVAPESSFTAEGQAERKPKYQAFAEDLGAGDAMDVDEDSPPIAKAKSTPISTAASSEAQMNNAETRTVPNGTAADSAVSADKSTDPGSNPLAGLGNVEPFLPATNRGLGLDELKDSLPFKSGTSQTHPTKPNTAQKLKYPEIPVAPPGPAKLDPASTNDYFSRMENYVRQYRKWNQNMMSHFAAREEELNDLEDRFIHQRGETTNRIGFPGYLARMKEDESVIATWQIGQEKHIAALETCQDVRNKTMKQYIASG